MATPEWFSRLKRRTAEIIDFENDALDPTKEAKIYFRWDTWQMGAFGDKTFFKELVKKCPLMSSYGIEEWLDFQPL